MTNVNDEFHGKQVGKRRPVCGQGVPAATWNTYIRVKVLTNFTVLIINNLNAYTIPYIFRKVFTSLIFKNLNLYINVNGVEKPKPPALGMLPKQAKA